MFTREIIIIVREMIIFTWEIIIIVREIMQCIIPFHGGGGGGGGGGGYIFLIKDTAWTWTPKINCHIKGLREYQQCM